ncbi:MAG: hypothetical protein U5O69_09080 [Candidatus Competibacteraceae bacterium]|nr:hypothetical protein [Candidatus Competibacteraceae bacterium]
MKLTRTTRPRFKAVFRELQRGQVIQKLVFMDGCYLLSLDGTGLLCVVSSRCSSSLEKKISKTGEIRYAHQLLGGAIVHPDFAEVILLHREAIIKQDGESKNDCERNARRFLEKLRQDHPLAPGSDRRWA